MTPYGDNPPFRYTTKIVAHNPKEDAILKLTKKQRRVAEYVTIGLAIGLSWSEARRIARAIVYG